MKDRITCPSCGTTIAVSETLTAQIRQDLQQEFDKDARRKDAECAARLEGIQQREHELDIARRTIEQEVAQRLDQERDSVRVEAANKAKNDLALEIADLQGQLTTAKTKVTEAQKAEMQLRKERRQLEEQKQELQLLVERTVDAERATVRDEAKRQADEEHRLHEADKNKLVADLRRQIDDLKRKAEQGSQQAQGEVLELDLEGLLRNQFPMDQFEAVPVGVHGGDILQRVHDGSGTLCGTIIWEAKRTKAWNDNWLAKLRDDQRAARAHAAVLLTVEMPKGHTTFGWIDGIWVTNRSCLLGLATALRNGMIELARNKRSLEGRQNKIELLLNYLASPEFRQRVEGIVEAFVTLKDDLESEKRSIQRLWAKREKQIERAVLNTAGLYGDFSGIVGPSLPHIPNLELAVIAADANVIGFEPSPANYADSPF